MRFSLHDIAPRLARARDSILNDLRLARVARERHRDDGLRLERLLAHRELQLVRACAKGKPGYISLRQRKLRDAERLLAAHRSKQVPA